MELLEAIAPLTTYSSGAIAIFIGVLARISALVFFLPGIGERMIAVHVRLGAAMAMALILTPFVMASPVKEPATITALISVIVAESICGAVIGFSIRIAVYTLQIAGAIAAQGSSISQLFGGIDGAPEPPIGTVFMLTGITIAVAAGLHFEAVKALAASYDIMPFGRFPGSDETGDWALNRVAWGFSAALALAMPFLILGFVYNLAIGAANRAMPQLMVAFVGAPAIALASFALMAMAAPAIFTAWQHLLDQSVTTLLGGAL